MPLSSVKLTLDGDTYHLEGRGNERLKLGYFKDLDQAVNYLESRTRPDFSTVIVPNYEIADAFGMNLIPLVRRGDSTVMSNRVSKILCSAIADGLY